MVFAHPTVYKSMPLLRELVAEGAIDGIEVHHPRNSPEDRAECAELCKKHDLIVTGGSDFHGANHGKPHPVVPASPRTTRSRASRHWPASAGRRSVTGPH